MFDLQNMQNTNFVKLVVTLWIFHWHDDTHCSYKALRQRTNEQFRALNCLEY